MWSPLNKSKGDPCDVSICAGPSKFPCTTLKIPPSAIHKFLSHTFSLYPGGGVRGLPSASETLSTLRIDEEMYEAADKSVEIECPRSLPYEASTKSSPAISAFSATGDGLAYASVTCSVTTGCRACDIACCALACILAALFSLTPLQDVSVYAQRNI